jgi:hypothetical protein
MLALKRCYVFTITASHSTEKKVISAFGSKKPLLFNRTAGVMMKVSSLINIKRRDKVMKQELEKLAEVRNHNGEALWSVWMNVKDARAFIDSIDPLEELGSQTGKEEESEHSRGHNDDRMTHAQKRFLFRLLAERGIEGEAAYRHLKETFGVDCLKTVAKFEASRAIDRILRESKEVEDHDSRKSP